MIPKFRVWDSWRKRMAVVDRIYIDTKGVRLYDDFGEYWRDFNDIELMQSTGLKDKNGMEIFEGDIVKRYSNPLFKAEWEYQIETVVKSEACLLLEKKFGKNSATMRFGSPFAKSDLLEVIGNVYENPELLG